MPTNRPSGQGISEPAKGSKDPTPGGVVSKEPKTHYLVSAPDASPHVDESRMSARGLLATSARDRQGDVLLVEGLDVSNHRNNPVVLIDHGLHHSLPIGTTLDRDSGEYSVEVLPDVGEVWQTTYFSQKSQVAEQVFALIAEGVLRANSIGFRPIDYEVLPPDPEAGLFEKERGKRPYMLVHKSELIEASWCGIPVNPEAVRMALSRDRWVGKSLCSALRETLEPYLSLPGGSRKYWQTYADTLGNSIKAYYSPTVKQLPPLGCTWDEIRAANDKQLTNNKHIHSDTTYQSIDKSMTVKSDSNDRSGESPMGEESKPAELPYGAKCMGDMHKHLCRAMHCGSKAMPLLEHEGVKGHMANVMKALDGMTGDTEALHAKHYGAHEKLDRESIMKSFDAEESASELDVPAEEDLDEELESEEVPELDEDGKALSSEDDAAMADEVTNEEMADYDADAPMADEHDGMSEGLAGSEGEDAGEGEGDNEEEYKSLDGVDGGEGDDLDDMDKALDGDGDEEHAEEDEEEKAMSAGDESAGGALIGEGAKTPKRSSVTGGQWREKPAVSKVDKKKSLTADDKILIQKYKQLREANRKLELRLSQLGL